MTLVIIRLLILLSLYITAVDAAKHYIARHEILTPRLRLYSSPESARVSDRTIYLADEEGTQEIKGVYLLVVAYVLWRTK